nr:autotransporter outer membrane beta-barrel domain-containing protein [Orbus hercynius]
MFKKANGEGDLYYLATKADKDDATNPTLPEDKPTITTTADAAGNALLSSYLINFSEIQSLSDRLRNANEDNTGAWGKIYAGKFDSFGSDSLNGFDLNYSAIQLGVDKQFALTEHANIVHGFSAQYTDGSIDYSRGGDGNIKSYSFAYYLSFFNADNFYNDAIFKFSRMKSNFYVQDTAGMSVSGDAMMNVYSFSNELGKKIYFNQDKTGFNINPFGQVILSKFSSSNYSASNGLNVHLDSRQSVIGKIGSYFSYDVDSNSKLYAKAAYVKEFNKGTQFYLNASDESLTMNGHWMEYQVGTKFNITDNQEINLSGTFLAGDKFNQKQLSLSYRYSF